MVNEIDDFIYSAPRAGAPQLVRANNTLSLFYHYSINRYYFIPFRYYIDTLLILYNYVLLLAYISERFLHIPQLHFCNSKAGLKPRPENQKWEVSWTV